MSLLAKKYYIPRTGVVFLRGSCPTNEGSTYAIGIIVLRGRCLEGVLFLEGNCTLQSSSCPRGVIAPWGSCPKQES